MITLVYFFTTLIILSISISENLVLAQVPQGAVTKEYDLDNPYLPQGFRCGISWAQATMLDSNDTSNSKVIIDYIIVYQINKDGSLTEIDREDYDEDSEEQLSEYKGGLYTRSPWYGGNDDHTPIYASMVRNGLLTMQISDYPRRIFHFWGHKFEAEPYANYAVGMRCKIIGACALSVGFDWWRDFDSKPSRSNISQAFCSRWYGDTQGQFITIFEKIKQ